jgi:hypothetical protein
MDRKPKVREDGKSERESCVRVCACMCVFAVYLMALSKCWRDMRPALRCETVPIFVFDNSIKMTSAERKKSREKSSRHFFPLH